MRRLTRLTLLLCALAPAAALAQDAAVNPPAPLLPTPQLLPDIELTAHVSAESVHFASKPQVTVTFPGSPDRTNVWDSVRTHLPDAVLPGRTYEDVAVDLTISTTLDDDTPQDAAPSPRSPR